MRAHGGALLCCSLATAVAGLGACATEPAAPKLDNSLDRLLADSAPATIETPPAAPPRASGSLEARMNETVAALEQVLARADEAPAAARTGGLDDPAVPDDEAGDGAEGGRDGEAQPGAPEPAAAANPAGTPPPAPSPPPPISLDDIPAPQLAEALAQRLWIDAAENDPFGAGVTLAFLERYFELGPPEPGAGAPSGPRAAVYRRLTPGQRQTLSAMRHLAHETLRGEARSGETGPVGDVFDSLVFSLWDRDPVRIRDAVLCEEVRRFGDYDELPSSRFLAGESARMIVYVELDRFGNIPDGAGWKVDLALEINIFSDSGRTLVWRMPETSYAMASSRPLRDVFLPAIVELPPTLGAGRYAVKAIVRDRSDGSVDERILMIDLVADPRLR